MTIPLPLAAPAAILPLVRPSSPEATTASVLAAATLLLPRLERGARIDAAALRGALETAFDASDASGAWDWKLAYEAGEVATVLFLRKYGRALFRHALAPAARLAALGKIAALLATHTRRSEESEALQQFSTPLPLGLAALSAAAVGPSDVVLEPSAGTGLLAILAEIVGGALFLNELAETRAGLLAALFPQCPITRFDAAQIDDHLEAGVVPSVVLMNPPFSALAHVWGRVADAGFRHVASALNRLAPGGRLVAITGANVGPELPAWRDAFVRLQERGTVVFSAAIAGTLYARHRHRQASGRGRGNLPRVARDGAGRHDLARLDRDAGAAEARGRPAAGVRASNWPGRPCSIGCLGYSKRSAAGDPGRRLGAGCGGAGPRGDRRRAGDHWTADRGDLRALLPADDPHRRRAATSDAAGAVGGDGLGRAAEARLPAAAAQKHP
jgi:hypothetical protein